MLKLNIEILTVAEYYIVFNILALPKFQTAVFVLNNFEENKK